MSSNIKIQKFCEYCGAEFTAKTTVTRYCGDDCAKRAYKARKRAEKINTVITDTGEKKQTRIKPIENLSNKEFLTVTQVSKLIGCSRQNIYKMLNSGQLKGTNILKKKTIILRKDLDGLFIKRQEQPTPEPKKYDISECYTIGEVQEKYNISQTALQNIIKRENIPKIKKGKFVYIPKELIESIFK